MDDITGTAVPIREANLNTDQIIPARYLKKPRGTGYHDYLFQDLRFDEDGNERPDFALNQSKYSEAKIIVGGQNFACGSSREGAVYALVDYGIRCVIAPGYSDIFHANCMKNFLLPVVLPEGEVEKLWEYCETADHPILTVSLKDRMILFGDQRLRFFVEDEMRKRLLEGKDDIDLTLEYLSEIELYEDRERHPV